MKTRPTPTIARTLLAVAALALTLAGPLGCQTLEIQHGRPTLNRSAWVPIGRLDVPPDTFTMPDGHPPQRAFLQFAGGPLDAPDGALVAIAYAARHPAADANSPPAPPAARWWSKEHRRNTHPSDWTHLGLMVLPNNPADPDTHRPIADNNRFGYTVSDDGQRIHRIAIATSTRVQLAGPPPAQEPRVQR